MQVLFNKDDMPGIFVPTTDGQQAFVPNALPPTLIWDSELASAVSQAERALGRLGGAGQDLPNPHLLIRPFLQREALLSSEIEGTQASASDLVMLEVDPQIENRVPDVREVVNYVRALEYGLQRQKNLPLSLRLLRELHGILMEGVRGENRTPGKFRRSQVHIGSPGASIDQARYIPPPPSHLSETLDEFEKFLHTPSDLPSVVRLALVHYQFEAIHPFMDGNGRIGRLLISLTLCLDDILPLPLLYLSAYFHRNREEYYSRLLQVSAQGAWMKWVLYFARGVAIEANDAADRVQRLKDLHGDYTRRVQTARASALLTALIDELFNRPVVTVAIVTKLLKVTPPTAHRHVDRLIELGILRLASPQRKRNRIYVADGILRTAYDAELKEV